MSMYFVIVDFMFPSDMRQEHMKISGESGVKAFCKDHVEKIEIMFILATVSSVLVILSLVSTPTNKKFPTYSSSISTIIPSTLFQQ